MECSLKIQWVASLFDAPVSMLVSLGSNGGSGLQRENHRGETRCESQTAIVGHSRSRTLQVRPLTYRIESIQFNHMWWCSFLVFRSITRAYYRNSVGVLLIYDTTNYVSFTHVTNWLTDARAQIEPYQSVFLLVGTKIDRESERQVTWLHAEFFFFDNFCRSLRSLRKKAKHSLISTTYRSLKHRRNRHSTFKKRLHWSHGRSTIYWLKVA